MAIDCKIERWPDGKRMRETYFSDYKEECVVKNYDREGDKESIHYVRGNGSIEKETYYFKSGNRRFEIHYWGNGEKKSKIIYREDGSILKEWYYDVDGCEQVKSRPGGD